MRWWMFVVVVFAIGCDKKLQTKDRTVVIETPWSLPFGCEAECEAVKRPNEKVDGCETFIDGTMQDRLGHSFNKALHWNTTACFLVRK